MSQKSNLVNHWKEDEITRLRKALRQYGEGCINYDRLSRRVKTRTSNQVASFMRRRKPKAAPPDDGDSNSGSSSSASSSSSEEEEELEPPKKKIRSVPLSVPHAGVQNVEASIVALRKDFEYHMSQLYFQIMCLQLQNQSLWRQNSAIVQYQSSTMMPAYQTPFSAPTSSMSFSAPVAAPVTEPALFSVPPQQQYASTPLWPVAAPPPRSMPLPPSEAATSLSAVPRQQRTVPTPLHQNNNFNQQHSMRPAYSASFSPQASTTTTTAAASLLHYNQNLHTLPSENWANRPAAL